MPRLVRGGVTLVAGDLLGKAAAVAAAIVVARALPVVDFGTYSFAVAYASFFSYFVDLGLDAVVTRELAARPDDEGLVLGSAAAAKAILVVAGTVIALVALLGFEADLRIAGLVALVSLVADVPGTISLVLTARVQVVGVTVLRLVGAVLTLVATILAAVADAGPLGYTAVFAGGTLGTALAVAVLARRRRPVPLSADWPTVRHLLVVTAPVAVSVIGMIVYRRIDQLLLGAFGEVRELAGYAAAVRLVDALNFLPAAVATVALPALARRDAEAGDRLAARGFRLLAAVILPVAAVSTAAGGTLLSIPFGERYAPYGGALAILLWAHFFGFTGALLHQVLLAKDLMRPLALLTLLGAAVNVALDLLLIPAYGADGAAWASLVSYATPFVGGAMVPSVAPVFRAMFAAAVRPALAAVGVLVTFHLLDPSRLVLVLAAAPVVVVWLLVTKATTIAEVRGLVGTGLGRRETVS